MFRLACQCSGRGLSVWCFDVGEIVLSPARNGREAQDKSGHSLKGLLTEPLVAAFLLQSTVSATESGYCQ